MKPDRNRWPRTAQEAELARRQQPRLEAWVEETVAALEARWAANRAARDGDQLEAAE